MHVTLSPSAPTKIWHGVFFPRRGSYFGAIIRFTISFDSPSLVPEVHFQTRVFHPLVDRTTGRVSLSGDGTVISELLEELKAAFENDEVLDRLSVAQVADEDAWKCWNGRREGTGGWTERVGKYVKASQDEDKPDKADEVILLRGNLGDVEQGAVDRIRGSVGERLRERGIKVREY